MPLEPVTLARHAMATRFEVVLHGQNPVALRAAGEAALDEIERLENTLSLYRTSTEIAHVNARAAHEPVRLSVPVFRLLQHALQLSRETGGAFDITIAPLVRCWGFMANAGRVPSADELGTARAQVGWQLLELDPAHFTVRFARPGMMIDLGAIGKGYAIDCAVDLLREAGVESALIHGGTSSIYAVGHPPDAAAWSVALRPPDQETGVRGQASGIRQTTGDERHEPDQSGPVVVLPTIPLRDRALSVSAVWGKSFQTADHHYGHVIDPRTGEPSSNALLAAVALPSTTETDALSTALLTLGAAAIPELLRYRPDSACVVITGPPHHPTVTTAGC